MTAAVETVIKIHKMEGPGDVLVFMPGQEEVDSVVHALKDEVLPSSSLRLHSDMDLNATC